MRQLHHSILSPFCRKVRLALVEKGLSFDLVEENIWKPQDSFLEINPLNTLPVLQDKPGDAASAMVLSHGGAILEYLEEVYPEKPLIFGAPAEKAEIRRLAAWFDERFEQEVGQYLLFEKIDKRRSGMGAPDMDLVRLGLDNIRYHMEYVSLLTEKRNWLAGDEFSLADVVAASHLSSIDYLGDVPWVHFPRVKEWYVRIKSRPTFRSLLSDRFPGVPPSRHYANLDF